MAAETATLPRTVKMWGRGQLTIPRDIREEIGFGENTVASIVRIGRSIVITPKLLRRVSLAGKVEKAAKRGGISLKDLIRDLERERDRYNRENYPS
jgi:bifunctional DNA-binding transcriptional regulator/antitoxin component of YhaV-PrlF toxin-antitoxin module